MEKCMKWAGFLCSKGMSWHTSVDTANDFIGDSTFLSSYAFHSICKFSLSFVFWRPHFALSSQIIWNHSHRFRFQKACVAYGVPDVDLFQTTDLWDKKNIALVTTTIFAIGRTAYKHPEWRGPWLGPKPSEENKREFTEEQIIAGKTVIGLQAGTNKGASQAGQNFGASRKIILGK